MAHRSDGPALSLGCLGMGTEQCAVVDVNSKCWKSVFLLDTCLHTRQTRQTRRASENVNRANMESVGRGNSVRPPIRDDAAAGRHHCQCYLRSLEYCRFT